LATAQTVAGFVFILIGIIVGAIAVKKIGGLENSGGIVMAIGGAAGFVIDCLLNIWPQWLLLVAGILVVILAVGYFLKTGNIGG
jgi:hypothetical protein